METVFGLTVSYPTFLWITTPVILFIAGDKPGKTAA
ncbi:hypothetical protein EHW99_2880 [Erwinia amylovora]|uniref:Uncharacterized protein n=3 Tax=Erwinia amylovora TaxID=552 RepID=A0A831EP91_ERWAM|nr:hypothetical protein EaACW_0706 [Erwinia amylovora ACW56400]QJQ55579.1 hypothetical protein EHX00_2880 [Erwinia amylovora]CBA19649.1 hypothetical protein predicted by Glimmer/Critica [Erwinia amylovora CFBP1430]CBX79543.1 hypothetical protein predicted by Glimmer/Critica [Erwinia amylovora ATCC BAA-2158]CCO77553.1 hypothetical protein BN432_0723 [Erwinia amylovora Ea356]CCO81337.1 hypothetical protein BN433_0733 [Erwinia amylovora Ea266]CCO85141.1 hypothetical protein BN434_0721 [Erwinia a